MKVKLASLIVVLAVTIFIGCGKQDNQTQENKNGNEKQQTGQKNEQKSSENKTLQVSGTDKAVEVQCSGMTCVGCENTIKSKVKKVDGVKEVIADHKTNVVKAAYDPAKTTPDAIKEAITSAGYKVESIK